MQTQTRCGTSAGNWAQPWLKNQQSLLICTKSAVSALVAKHIWFSLKRGAVSGACSARAPQQREEPPHNMAMSCGHVHEFYSPFMLLEQPKDTSVWVHLAGLMPSTEQKEFDGLPVYVRHHPHFAICPAPLAKQTRWHKAGRRSQGFGVPPPRLCSFVTSNSVSHQPQKPDGTNMKPEHSNLCSSHFQNFPLNPLLIQVILLQG